jgi:methenyltetrahydromethanopterin cyclohydrolase
MAPIVPPISLNRLAWKLFERLEADAAELRLGPSRGPLGERLIDAGAAHVGGIEAGRRIAELCLAGLGSVSLLMDEGRFPLRLRVASSQPVLATLGSQYAGWSLQHEKFFALGSGPARALAAREPLFAELGYRDAAEHGVLVLESPTPPPPPVVEKVAEAAGLPPRNLGIVFAPTQSLAGSVQVVARVLEVALHKAHELGFPLARILDGAGSAPLAPPHPDFVTAMGRTNDAIIFGGTVHLFVSGPAAEAAALARALPASASRDYGRPFAEIFRAAKGDFYAIDRALFSPARVRVTALETGETFEAGAIDEALLARSFGEAD